MINTLFMEYNLSAIPQKRLLQIISFGVLSERFGYYGALAILVLYLSKVFSFSDEKSYSLYWLYVTMAFAMPVIGGLLADRVIGAKHALFAGGLFLIAGNILLFIPNFGFLCLGLAFMIWGSALFKCNAASLVGTLSKDNTAEKEYTFFYMVMNIGSLLGPIFYGIASQTIGWRGGFIASATLITLWQIIFMFNFRHIVKTEIKTFIPKYSFASNQKIKIVTYLLIFSVSLLTAYLLFCNIALTGFLITFGAISIVALLVFAFKQSALERNRILGLIILAVFAMIFFSASLQVVSSISLFIERNVNHTLFGWTIPTPTFSALYPMFVIILAPFIMGVWSYFKNQNKPVAITTKFIIALLFACLGFVSFSLATSSSIESHQPLFWIILGNLFLGMGEVCLMPTILSAISQFSPQNLRGTMIRLLFLFIAFSGYLSSLLAKTTSITISIPANVRSPEIYTHGFILVLVMTLIAAIILFLFKPVINSLLNPSVLYDKT